MMKHFSRRNFLRGLGISTAALPFINGLPSIQANVANDPKKRLKAVKILSDVYES